MLGVRNAGAVDWGLEISKLEAGQSYGSFWFCIYTHIYISICIYIYVYICMSIYI